MWTPHAHCCFTGHPQSTLLIFAALEPRITLNTSGVDPQIRGQDLAWACLHSVDLNLTDSRLPVTEMSMIQQAAQATSRKENLPCG